MNFRYKTNMNTVGIYRPYSLREVGEMEKNLEAKFKLGSHIVHHNKCRHGYKVKKDSRKEKLVLEKNSSDVGNCSVCWKLHQEPTNEAYTSALDLV